MNLTGYTARAQIRPSKCSGVIVAEMTTPASGIVIDPLTGKFTLSLSAPTTAAIAPGQYMYDLEATAPGSSVTRVCGGAVSFSAEVTR